MERTLGADLVFDEAMERLIAQVYDQVVADQGLEPIGPPHLELLERTPVRFKATVPLEPEVDAGDYQSIPLAKDTVEVSDEMVDNAILEVRRHHAVLEPVDRALAYNDRVQMDIAAEIEGKEILNEEKAEFFLREDTLVALPGVADNLLGLKTGTKHRLDIEMPEDFDDEEVAGKTVTFRVTIHEIKQENLPEADNALAQEAGEFESFAAFRERVEQDLRRGAENQAKDAFHEKLIEAVVERASVEFPPVLVDQETDRQLNDLAQRLGLSLQAYAQQQGPQNVAALRNAMRPQAEQRVRTALVLDAVAKVEQIEPTPADLQAEVERIAGTSPQADQIRSILDDESGRSMVRRNLITSQTLKRLEEIAARNAAAGGAASATEELSQAEAAAGEPASSDASEPDAETTSE